MTEISPYKIGADFIKSDVLKRYRVYITAIPSILTSIFYDSRYDLNEILKIEHYNTNSNRYDYAHTQHIYEINFIKVNNLILFIFP